MFFKKKKLIFSLFLVFIFLPILFYANYKYFLIYSKLKTKENQLKNNIEKNKKEIQSNQNEKKIIKNKLFIEEKLREDYGYLKKGEEMIEIYGD